MKINEQYRSYAGGLLRVNLTTGKMERDTRYFEYETLSKYIGGKGLAAHILYQELEPGVDPLGPDNPFLLLTGPLTGTGAITGCRLVIAAKGPTTGYWLDSNAGGFFGPDLKKTGYDGIMLKNRAEKPVYLYIREDGAEILDAENIWGLEISKTNSLLKEKHGEHVDIAAIGPPGERLTKISSVMIDGRAAGRGGIGSVMGSKNVKAIVLEKGSQKVQVFDPEALKTVNKKVRGLLSKLELWSNYGTSAFTDKFNETHAWSVKNFSGEKLDGGEQIYPDAIKEKIWNKNSACFACPIACTQEGVIPEGKWAGMETEGLEYQTIWAFGPQCGINDIYAIARADHLCSTYGLDTISTGATIGFLMECFEKGLLTLSDTDGLELRFGSAEAMVSAVEKAGTGESYLGQLVANGVREAAKKIGRGSEDFAVHVKGLEVSSYDPRRAHGMALAYARADRGACHVRPATHGVEVLGWGKSMDPFAAEGKAEMVKRGTEMGSILWDSSGLCKFAAWGISPQDGLDLLNAVTGFQINGLKEFSIMGQRVNNLIRLFNLREGMSAEEETLPPRILKEAHKAGPAAGIVLEENFKQMKKRYYELCGWDEQGVPREEKLRELGLAALD